MHLSSRLFMAENQSCEYHSQRLMKGAARGRRPFSYEARTESKFWQSGRYRDSNRDYCFPFEPQMLRCVAMVIKVSPSCVKVTPSKFSSSSVSLQASALATAVMEAVNSQEFKIESPHSILCERKEKSSMELEAYQKYLRKMESNPNFTDLQGMKKLVADCTRAMLKDGGLFLELKNTKKRLAQKVLEALRSVISRLKGTNQSGRTLYGTTYSELNKAEQMWSALLEGSRPAQSKNQIENVRQREYTDAIKHSLKEDAIYGQRAAAEIGKSAFEGNGTLHWEKVSSNYRRAAESHANFTRRMGQGGATTHRAESLLYGYRAVPLRKASSYAKEAVVTFKRFGANGRCCV